MNQYHQGKIEFGNYLETLKERKEEYEREHPEKIEFEFQELGIEMKKYFGRNLFWVFSMDYSVDDIRRAFNICKERDVKNYAYLLGILKNRRNGAF